MASHSHARLLVAGRRGVGGGSGAPACHSQNPVAIQGWNCRAAARQTNGRSARRSHRKDVLEPPRYLMASFRSTFPRPGPDRLSQKTSFWLEERRIAAEAEIERLRAEPNKYDDDEPPQPHSGYGSGSVCVARTFRMLLNHGE